MVRYPGPLRLETDHWISFANGEPMRLAGAGLYLRLIHNFRVVEAKGERQPYRITTTDYWYSLLDQDQRELVAYHYHPSAIGWCNYPHLHAETATGIISGKAHLVTERVTLVAIIRMLIEDQSIPVSPLRLDWAHVLTEKGDVDAVV